MYDVEALRAAEFPVTQRYAYFNHCGISAPPRRTIEAANTFLHNSSLGGTVAEMAWNSAIERTREKLASLINVSSAEIAFMKNTSEGLTVVAQAVDWQPGDVVLVAEDEFPATIYPWRALEREGVRIQMVPHTNERIEPELFEPYLKQGNVRLVSLSWVQFHTGWRADLAAFGALCRQYDALLCVDVMQGLGGLPLDLSATPVDFATWGGNKWLMAIQGAGGLYVNQRIWERLRPANVGWLGATWSDFNHLDPDSPLQGRAARYEEGTRPNVCIAALEATLDLHAELTPAAIGAHIRQQTDALVEGLAARGAQIRSQRDGEHWSGIVTWTHPDRNLEDDLARLTAADVLVTIREGSLRAAPHCYTNAADVARLLAVLDE